METGEARILEILIDDRFILKTEANIFREDLLIAGIGKGEHAFMVKTPQELLDGNEHNVTIIDSSTGKAIYGSPKVLCGNPSINASFLIEGSYLIGNIDFGAESAIQGPLNLVIQEGIDPLAMGVSDVISEGSTQFRIELPRVIFDGCWHQLSVYCAELNLILGSISEVMPIFSVDEDFLLKYSAQNSPVLSAINRYRYEAYYQSLKALVSDRVNSKSFRDINNCFDFISGIKKDFFSFSIPLSKSPIVSIIKIGRAQV